jgi:hypothetical protein
VYTVKNPPDGTGPNIQVDEKRLIYVRLYSLALCLPLWLMQFLMESTIFYSARNVSLYCFLRSQEIFKEDVKTVL